MTNLGTERLADLIGQKHRCLVQLRDIGTRQIETARGGEMDLLMQLLATKQRLLDQMMRVEQQLKPFRDQDPESRVWSSLAERQRCAAVANECESLLNTIVQQEKESERELIRRRDDAQVRLQGTHVAGHVHNAYVSDAAPTRSAVDYS